MLRPAKDHYCQLERWHYSNHATVALYINRYFDNQLTVDKKLLDELDVFGSITWVELIEGALRRRPSIRHRLSQKIINPKTNRLRRSLCDKAIDVVTAEQYHHHIQAWFDRYVGCGALAYRLFEQCFPNLFSRRKSPSELETRVRAGIQIFRPTHINHKTAIWITDSTALDQLTQFLRAQNIQVNIIDV